MLTFDEGADILHNVVMASSKLNGNNFSAYHWFAFNNLNQVLHSVYLTLR
ncbi:hypothetical protein LTSEUGA_1383 [Salmonella enterica subsp. enterica serovar Uganda str. R8-3404]|uniref:Uncharacterized protein n=1 Tax=Salmonella enterica subsp. enterica serovar Uganda str. R8-3404 TaxID=913083 RepID=A0A6C8H687_SALET|nr:hypothetical protein LTSEUGA_1383 [Salmonella enterica subsp. enterica serovar Uganda str. R8-3404]